jgi:hypothetical protein
MSKNILSEQLWPEVKKALLEGDDLAGPKNEYKKKVMGTLLENTRVALMENAAMTSTTAGNVATLNKVILPVIRRVMPTVICNEIIGVQPMTGPVGQISTMRVRYAETAGSPTPVTAGSEALSPFDIAKFYAGNLNSTTPGASATATLEGTVGKKLNIQIVKETVEAKTRKLSANWTFEAAQDAQAQYGIDLEAEVMGALAQEITAEIDQEILFNLRQLPGTPTVTFDQNQLTGVATFIGDEHAALASLINRQANLIAQRTRRGAGNWVVVSNAALTVLQSARTSAFARTTEGTFEAPTNTKFVGTLNNTMRVYVDAYASDSEVVLVGYKGNDTDAAAYFCPYIPLMSTGVVIDPSTFQPTTGFLTRYGYLELVNTSSSFGNAADYLGAISVANLRFA